MTWAKHNLTQVHRVLTTENIVSQQYIHILRHRSARVHTNTETKAHKSAYKHLRDKCKIAHRNTEIQAHKSTYKHLDTGVRE